MSTPRRPHRAAGLSLIEIMIALAITSLLVLGLVEVFAASRAAYQLSTGLARVQENGRFALDFLQRDIRMAGHLGCVNDQARFLNDDIPTRPALATTFLTSGELMAREYDQAPDPLRFDVGIEGHDANIGGGGAATDSGSTITLAATPVQAADESAWSPALDAGLFGQLIEPVQNSDIVVLRYFAPTGAQMESITPGSPTTAITFEASQAPRLTQGVTDPGLFGITDCSKAAVFHATTVDMSAGEMTVTLGSGLNESILDGPFGAGQSVIYRAESVVYYVGINGNDNPALYRLRYTANPGGAVDFDNEELVEGIESIQLQYGQDSRTAADQLPTGNIGSSGIATDLEPAADPVTAWRRVGLVQVGLVARSPDPAAAAQRDVDDVTITGLSALGVRVTPPEDGRYRTVYEGSIALRNRLFGN